MGKKLTLSREEHEAIQKQFNIGAEENYAVVTEQGKGYKNRSVHVFERLPDTKEIMQFENDASRVKFRGRNVEVEGSQTLAGKHLYDFIIKGAYNVLVGRAKYTTLDREQAKKLVPVLTKREAIRDLVAGVWSEAQLADMEGEEQDVETGAKEED